MGSDGATGELDTIGNGGSSNKDALISIAIRMSYSICSPFNLRRMLKRVKKVGRKKSNQKAIIRPRKKGVKPVKGKKKNGKKNGKKKGNKKKKKKEGNKKKK